MILCHKYDMATKKHAIRPPSNNVLVYPNDLGASNGELGMLNNYMTFSFYKKVKSNDKAAQNVDSKTSKQNNKIETLHVKDAGIYLPLPTGLSSTNTLNWSEAELSTAGMTSSGDIKAALGNLGAHIEKGLASAIQGLLGGDGKAANEFQNKRILNPIAEMTFKGIGFRQFTFEWSFVPKNAKEAKTVENIVREFKKWSAPIVTPTEFKYPSYVKVEAKNNDKNIFDFKKCVINSVSVAYNDDGVWKTHADGNIAKTKLSISLTEAELINFQDDGKF